MSHQAGPIAHGWMVDVIALRHQPIFWKKDKYIISTGYNGAPHGLAHCDEVNHMMENGHCVRTTHAEQNAIIQAAVHGSSTKQATLYSTHSPCKICTKIILNAHIIRVVAKNFYRDCFR